MFQWHMNGIMWNSGIIRPSNISPLKHELQKINFVLHDVSKTTTNVEKS